MFNYIVACLGMLLLKRADPFHWGGIGRAMFTVLRVETLDSWDTMLYIGMYGCAEYPSGYPLTEHSRGCAERNSYGYGWIGAFVFLFIVVMGALILPTVLIGIVAIKYNEAMLASSARTTLKEEVRSVVEQSKVRRCPLGTDTLHALHAPCFNFCKHHACFTAPVYPCRHRPNFPTSSPTSGWRRCGF